jgi:hypothetical protein
MVIPSAGAPGKLLGLTTRQSFEAVLATEAPVLVMDLDRWEPVEEVLLARGCKLPKNRQVPLLDSHNRTSVREGQVGSVRDIRIAGRATMGVTLFKVNDAEHVVSAARIRETDEEDDGAEVDGAEGDGAEGAPAEPAPE